MKTTTRNTRIANFGKVVRCFHADKDISFNSIDYFGAVALALNEVMPDLIPGVKVVAVYGHTPGHTAFLFESDNEKLFVWGDLTHAMKIQMPCPEVAVTYNVDPALATQSRKEALEYVSRHQIPVAGMHIAFPGMGEVSPGQGNGYQFRSFRNIIKRRDNSSGL
jgi:glyoxylase-like metal-dependent hydrolase (beta-lactamase superfamily II)